MSDIIPLPERFVVRLTAARKGELTEEERRELFRELAEYEEAITREPETKDEWDAYEKNIRENHPSIWREYEEMCADPTWVTDTTYAPPNIHTFING